MDTISQMFMVMTGVVIGVAAILILQFAVKAHAAREETGASIEVLNRQMEEVTHRLDRASAAYSNLERRLSESLPNLEQRLKAADDITASDIQGLRAHIGSVANNVLSAVRMQKEEADNVSALCKRAVEAVGALDLRYQFAKDAEREIVNRLGSVEDIVNDMEDRVITLEARVSHRKRKPKEANPTDGTTDPSEPGPDNPDYTVTVGDLEPLNPTIFKEVASSFIDK